MAAKLKKLKLFIAAVVLGGLLVGPVGTGATAAVPVDPLGLTAAETQQFKSLIDPATWDVRPLIDFLEVLRALHPGPGDIGEISLDLALLVEDDNPNRDTILALIQDMLATAAGNQFFVVPTNTLNLSENPCQDASSPVCNN